MYLLTSSCVAGSATLIFLASSFTEGLKLDEQIGCNIVLSCEPIMQVPCIISDNTEVIVAFWSTGRLLFYLGVHMHPAMLLHYIIFTLLYTDDQVLIDSDENIMQRYVNLLDNVIQSYNLNVS